MINLLPINKIFLTALAFILTHWRKIGQISLVPLLISLPFFLLLPEFLLLMAQVFQGTVPPKLPENSAIYLVLFLYGYFILSINMYRLVLLGEESVRGLGLVLNFGQIVRFIGLNLLIALVTLIPVLITGILFLQLVMYFIIVPITLNFVNIAINQPSKYRWSLSFRTQMNLFFLQVVLPVLINILFAIFADAVGFSLIELGGRVLMFYWTLITLAFCYQLISAQTSTV